MQTGRHLSKGKPSDYGSDHIDGYSAVIVCLEGTLLSCTIVVEL